MFFFFFLSYLSVMILRILNGLMFLLEIRSMLLFLINEDGFNTKTSDLILVIYKHCKLYP